MFPPVFVVQSFATLSAGKCCYPDGRIPIVELRSSKKIERNLLTDSVIYVTLYTNNRFGYLKEQNSNGKIFSAFTGETGNNP